jgi:hypothetical protein
MPFHPGQPNGPISFEDFGLAAIEEELRKLAATEITIGWQGDSGAEIHPGSDDKSVAEIAAFHELGTVRMDARPSLERTFATNDFEAVIGKAMSDLVDGRNDDPAKVIGEAAVEALRKTIDDSRAWAKPLAESTAKSKGHDQPLVETFTMRANASWAERRGGTIVRQGGELGAEK